jgi:putative phosphoesterase
MKIGIISDTHGYPEKWQKALENFFKDSELIIHAGDVLYHGPRNPILDGYAPQKLAEFLNNCNIPLVISRGNCDTEVDQMVLNWPILAPYTFISHEGIRIMTLHGHNESSEQLMDIAQKYKVNIIITGHTHIRVLEKNNGIVFLNPGSVSLPKGDNLPSLAILENNLINIYNCETGEILNSMEL